MAAETLTDWKSWNKVAPLLVETAKAHWRVESKGMSVAEMGAQNTSVEEEENRSVPRTIRIELALPRNLEKEKSTEKREKHLDKIKGECRVGRELSRKRRASNSTGAR